MNEVKKIKSLDDFVNLCRSRSRAISRRSSPISQDWESANRILDSSARILKLDETSIYLFVGPKVPLLPMIGSIKLFELKQKPATSLLRSSWSSLVSNDYTHVSVRGSGDRVHSGKFCGELQDSMQKRYADYKDKIMAAVTQKRLNALSRPTRSLRDVLTRVTEVLSEMQLHDRPAAAGKLDDAQKARADKLGLEYLKNKGNLMSFKETDFPGLIKYLKRIVEEEKDPMLVKELVTQLVKLYEDVPLYPGIVNMCIGGVTKNVKPEELEVGQRVFIKAAMTVCVNRIGQRRRRHRTESSQIDDLRR